MRSNQGPLSKNSSGAPTGGRPLVSSVSHRVQAAPLSSVRPEELANWQNQMPGGGGGGAQRRAPGAGVFLASLNTYQVGWSVVARVFSKSGIRSYKNERGEGQIASAVIVDSSGSMKFVMFGEMVDRFLPLLEEGKLFRFSGAKITPSRDNPNYHTTTTEYDMIAGTETQVTPAPETNDAPSHSLRFQPLSELTAILQKQQSEQGRGFQGASISFQVDVIGIIKEAGPMAEITSKKGQQLVKRDLVILDKSGTAIKLTIWGQEHQLPEDQLIPAHPGGLGQPAICNVIAVSAARISDYAGCSLSTGFSSSVFVNPPWPEAKDLKQWFLRQGKQLLQSGDLTMLSTGNDSSGGKLSQMILSPLQEIARIKAASIATPINDPVYLKVHVRISFVRKSDDRPPWYMACPTAECKGKKLKDSDHGQFWCDKCAQATLTPEPRYLLSMQVQDETGSQWLTCFNTEGNKIMNCTAQQLYEWKANNDDRYHQAFSNAAGTDWLMGVQAKKADPEKTQDSTPRFNVFAATPVGFAKDTSDLADVLATIESAGSKQSAEQAAMQE